MKPASSASPGRVAELMDVIKTISKNNMRPSEHPVYVLRASSYSSQERLDTVQWHGSLEDSFTLDFVAPTFPTHKGHAFHDMFCKRTNVNNSVSLRKTNREIYGGRRNLKGAPIAHHVLYFGVASDLVRQSFQSGNRRTLDCVPQ